MADLASLVLKVDSTQVAAAKTQLDSMGDASEKLTAKQDRFLQSMDKQVTTWGKGSAGARAYQAELLDLTDDKIYQRLNDQLATLESMGQKADVAAGGMGRFGDTMERVALRSAARFAIMGVAVQGSIELFKAFWEASDKAFEAQRKWVEYESQAVASAESVVKSIRDESENYNLYHSSVAQAGNDQERLKLAKLELMGMGPDFRTMLDGEITSWDALGKAIQGVTKEKLQHAKAEAEAIKAKGPDSSFFSDWNRGLNQMQNWVISTLPAWAVDKDGNFLTKKLDQMAGTSDMDNLRAWNEELDKANTEVYRLQKSLDDMDGSTAKPKKSGRSGKDPRGWFDPEQEMHSAQEEAAWEQAWLDKRDAAYLKSAENQRKITKSSYDERIAMAKQEDREREAALRDLLRVHTQVFGDMGNALENWSHKFSDTFVDACFTGKEAFGDMITSMLKDMARMAMDKNVSSMLFAGLGSWINSFGSFAGGQGNASITNGWGVTTFAPRASGGPVSAGDTYLVGENGPELYVPRSSGTIIPNGALGGNQNTSIVVNVTSDGRTDAKGAGANGVNLARVVQATVQAEIMRQKRVGGILE